jgi:hypothetical protein
MGGRHRLAVGQVFGDWLGRGGFVDRWRGGFGGRLFGLGHVDLDRHRFHFVVRLRHHGGGFGLAGLGRGQDAQRVERGVEIECEDWHLAGLCVRHGGFRHGRVRCARLRRGMLRQLVEVDQAGIAVEDVLAGATTHNAPAQLQLVGGDPECGVTVGTLGG